MHYFRRDGDWPGIGTGSVWIEFDGELATRQVELYDGRWYCSVEEFHPGLGGGLTDRYRGELGFVPAEEITAAEFEAAWEEALEHR